MVEEDSLRGVTSNPAIFEKAILGSPDYDDDLAAAAREGLSRARGLPPPGGEDVQLAADVLRAGLRRDAAARTATSRSRSRRGSRTTPRARSSRRAMYWGLVDRPNLMIKIPATEEGIPAIEQALYEGMNVNVTLLFAVVRLRARDGRVHPRDGAPPRGGQAARPPLRRLVLRLARRHRGRQAAGGARPQRPRRAAPGWPTPAPPTRPSSACSRASASPRCAPPAARSSARCGPRPASRTRATPRRCTSTASSAPHTVNTMPLPTLLAARAARASVDRRDRRRGPGGRPRRRCARPASTSTTSPPSCCATASRRSWSRWPSCSTAIERQARGDRHRPPRRDRRRPAGRARAARRRAACDAPPTRTSCAASGQRDGTLWAPEGTPEVDRPPRLARRSPTSMLEDARRPRGLRRARCATTGYTDAVLLGHGRLEPRARGVPPLVAPSRARCACTCSTRREPTQVAGRRSTRSTSTRRCSSSPRSPAGRSRRCRSSSYFHALQPDGAHFVAVTDPGTSLAKLGAEHGFRRMFENDPEIGGRYSRAVVLRARPRRAGRRRRRRRARGRRRSRWRTASCSEGNSGLWLGVALGELARHGRDKLTFVVDEPLRVVRPVGRAARRRVDRQAGPRHPADRRRAAGRPGRLRATTACSCTSRDARRGRRAHDRRWRAAQGRPPDDHAHTPTAPATSAGSSSSPSSPPRWPAGCWRSTRSTSPTCRRPRTTRRACSRKAPPDLDDGRPRRAARRPRAAALRGDHGLPAVRRRGRRGGRAPARRAHRPTHGVATTFGYGPRFLHSTGQFHKGGPPVGRVPPARRRARTDARGPGRAVHVRAR